MCTTCVQDITQCEGHFGHIEICIPVFNPFFVKTVYNLLRICCTDCFRLQLHDSMKSMLELQLNLVDAGYIVEAEELEVYKQKVAMDPNGELPEGVSYYSELLLNRMDGLGFDRTKWG